MALILQPDSLKFVRGVRFKMKANWFSASLWILGLAVSLSGCISPAEQGTTDESQAEETESSDGTTPTTLQTTDSLTLIPGTGFLSATSEPEVQGLASALGSTARAIARWDVVPSQTIQSPLHIGVLAYHIAGIDRVEVSLDNGPWSKVTSKTMNPDSGVEEYTTILDPSLVADGLHEVRAIAYPLVGKPRVLESLWIATDDGNSLPKEIRYVSTSGSDSNNGLTLATPKLTIASALISLTSREGATIYLAAGTYLTYNLSYPSNEMTNTNRWLTVTPNPGLTRDQVTLAPNSNQNIYWGKLKRVRFLNLTLDQSVE